MDSSFVQAVIAVIAIANPIGAAPIFLSLTDDLDAAARVRAAARVALAVWDPLESTCRHASLSIL